MTCRQCGTDHAQGARFCTQCGEALGVRAEAHSRHARSRLEDSGIFRLVPREYGERLIATRGRLRSERREITLLFMDIVNSTAMIEALDPEDALEVMNGAFAELVKPVAAHGGTVARLMGDGFLCFFGAPAAHEDDALRACEAALEMHRVAAAYADHLHLRRSIPSFQIRVGIATGTVVVGEVGTSDRVEYTAMGNAANLAARLEGLAGPGGTLISESTFRQVHGELHCEDAGLLCIRGQSQKARAYGLVGKSDRAAARHAGRSDLPLAGRTADLEALQEALAVLGQRRGPAVVVSGEAGIGKSRLIREAQRLCPVPCEWIHVHCSAESAGRAYASARQVMCDLVHVPRSADISTLLSGLRSRLSELWTHTPPEWARVAERTLPRADSERRLSALLKLDAQDIHGTANEERTEDVAAAVRATFRELALRSSWIAPTVIVWEDIHWIDPSSAELLYDIVALTSTSPLGLILAWRSDGWAAADVRRRIVSQVGDGFREIRLGPLPRQDAALMAEQLLGSRALPGPVVDQILERTGGNAFFLEEVVRGLGEGETQLQAAPAPGEATRSAVPETLQRAIIARLDRLNPADKHLLQTASVLGTMFSETVLADMLKSEVPPESVAESIERLRQREYLNAVTLSDSPSGAPGAWSFRHSLIADVAYGTLLRSQRQELHRAAAESLERAPGGRREERAGLLAHHYERGMDHPKALTYLLDSARVSLRLGAYRETAEYFRRATRVAEQCPRGEETQAKMATALEGLADIEYMSGHYSEALHFFEQAMDQAGSLEDRVRLLRKQSQVHEKRGRYDEADAALQESLRRLDHGHLASESAQVHSGLCRVRFHQGNLESARQLGQKALDMTTRLGDRRGVAQAHNDLGIIATREQEFVEAVKHLDLSLGMWRELGDPFGLAACFNNRGLLATEAGDLEGARAYYLQALRHFRRLGNRHGAARVLDNMSTVYLAQGDLEHACRYVNRAVRILAEIGVDQSGVLPEMWQSGVW